MHHWNCSLFTDSISVDRFGEPQKFNNGQNVCLYIFEVLGSEVLIEKEGNIFQSNARKICEDSDTIRMLVIILIGMSVVHKSRDLIKADMYCRRCLPSPNVKQKYWKRLNR